MAILACLLVFRVSHAAAAAPVVILQSDTGSSYSEPVKNFSATLNEPVRLFNLNGDLRNAPRLMAQIKLLRPRLIFALGAKAAVVAKTWTSDRQDIPVLFAMVLNWRKYNLLDQKNMAGIETNVAPGTNFANMTMVAPGLRRMGVITSKEHSADLIARARTEAERLGIQLVVSQIGHPDEFKQHYKMISDRIDSFWVLPDPVIYTLDNIAWLKKRCLRDNMICVGQSENIVKIGVLMAVDPDLANIGSQAAALAKQILAKGKTPAQIGIEPPLGTHLVINLKTADHIGLVINNQVRNIVNVLIE